MSENYEAFRSQQKIGIVAAAASELIHFTDDDITRYGSCRHGIIQNLSASTVKLTFNAYIDGTGAVATWGNAREVTLSGGMGVEISITDTMPFYNVVVTHVDGAALAAGDVVLKADNL
jgi:hypothetical protein